MCPNAGEELVTSSDTGGAAWVGDVAASQTVDYLATNREWVPVDCTGGDVHITTPVGENTRVIVQRTDRSSHSVIVAPASGLINGVASITLAGPGSIEVGSDGTHSYARSVPPAVVTNASLGSDGAVVFDVSTVGNGGEVVQPLAANATSSTVTGGFIGQEVTFVFKQDGTGGRTYAYPANMKFGTGVTTGTTVAAGPPTATVASKATAVRARFDGTNWNERGRAVNVG